MAVYDIDADPITAVAAFLAQFSIANDGAIRYVANADTFHVAWLHRSLQHKVWDFTTSGDDDVQLSDPNPSTSQALGRIISLVDNTPQGFAVRYNIDDAVAERLFGGSVTQKNATGQDEAWYALTISGSAGGSVQTQVVQNGVQLTSYWGTGLNQTGDNIVARIMIKAVNNGVLIDNGVVTVKAHDFGFGFSNFTTTLALTEAFSSVSADNDPFNNTALGTVSAYAIAKSEGFNSLDLDGNGNKPFLGAWSYSPEDSKGDLYEFVKFVLSRDSGETVFGVNSNVWTGRVFEVAVDAGNGTDFQQSEAITWQGGAGNLVGMDDLTNEAEARLWLHLQTGVPPVTTDTITGASTGATTVVQAGGSTTLSTSANLLGQFTGSWIGAFGIGFDAAQVTNTDSFTDLDGNTISPPNFVSVQINVETVNAADEPRIFMTLRNGSSANYAQHTVDGAQASGAGTVTIDGAIPPTTPTTGWIGILAAGSDNIVFYEFTSWSGSTFTLASTLSEAYADGDQLTVAHFYNAPTGAGTAKSANRSLIYGGVPIDIIGWIRQGSEAAPDSVIPFSGQIGAAGFTFSGTLSREA